MNVFAIAAAIVAFASAALAEPITRVENGLAVHYGDLDLNAAEGQDTFAARIDQAVARECRSTRVQTIQDRRACREQTRADVMAAASHAARGALVAADARKNGASKSALQALAAR